MKVYIIYIEFNGRYVALHITTSKAAVEEMLNYWWEKGFMAFEEEIFVNEKITNLPPLKKG